MYKKKRLTNDVGERAIEEGEVFVV